MRLGIALPEGVNGGDLLAAVDALPATPSHVPIWCRWGDADPYPSAIVRGLHARGIRPAIFWEPTGAAGQHRSILRGDHDDYVDRFAHAIADAGVTVLLRFAHEMNDRFFPWTPGKGTNTAESYVKAWRYVVGRVRDITPRALSWWCPNVTPLDTIRQTWPGAFWVDRIGLDGYAWRTPLRSAARIFGPALAILRDLSDRPVIIGEFAATPATHRGRWVRQTVDWFEEQRVTAAIWLSMDLREMGHRDWRIAPDVWAAA